MSAKAVRHGSVKLSIHTTANDPELKKLVESGTGGILDTDMGNAARLARRHSKDLRFTAARGWSVWDGKRWAIDEKALRVQALAKETARSIFAELGDVTREERDNAYRHAKKSQSKNSIEAMVFLARSEPGIAVKITDFDGNGWLLNVANGTVDLRTGRLRAHQREDLISAITEVAFDASAACERWESFLRQSVNDNDELYAYLRRFVGYLLVGDTSDQSLHFLYGLGANGKSVFCEVVMHLLGEYAVACSPDLIMLRRHSGIPNDVARLRGVRVALMNETTQGARFDEAKLKDLTGGDTISARFLHQEFFDFKPTHRLVIRGNHKPAINGTDEGIWRRLRLVPFTVTVPEDQRDAQLLSKLKRELPGILNWAIAGCLEWQDKGLKPPAIIIDAVARYREESDTVGRFLSECCQIRALAQVKASVLFERYRSFCDRSDERSLPLKDFPGEMERRGFSRKREKSGVLFLGLELIASDVSDWRSDS
jgi:putative DNA primase/helicase